MTNTLKTKIISIAVAALLIISVAAVSLTVVNGTTVASQTEIVDN